MKFSTLSLHSVLLSCIISQIFGENAPLCTFGNHLAKQDEMHKRLQPLLGKRFEVKDKYRYIIGICVNVDDKKTFGDNVGVVQTEMTSDPSSAKHWIIGNYNDSQLIEGTDWVILEYNGGDLYSSHCGNERRRARIMITCDETVKLGYEAVTIFTEEANKNEDCYYLFEMGTSTVCKVPPLVTVSLSIGSILVIVFVIVVFLYGVAGFLYNRLILGAKGKEQIPNYGFWQDFGNLQADGCDLVCRSGKKTESRQYKGVGDDQLETADDRDDHLLPM